MVEKLKFLGVIWFCVIFAYIFLAFTNDVTDSIAANVSAEMASQNLSASIVGIEEAMGSFNFWKWPIPALLGIVLSVVTLREEIIEKVKGE